MWTVGRTFISVVILLTVCAWHAQGTLTIVQPNPPVEGIEILEIGGKPSIAIREDLTDTLTPTNGLVIGTITSDVSDTLTLVPNKLNLKLDPSTGTLTLLQKLDHDSLSMCPGAITDKYSCIADNVDIKEGLNLPFIYIIVTDANDNDPQFKQVHCDGNIEENKEYPAMCTFEAEDADRWVDKDPLKFSLKTTSEIFEINEGTGVFGTILEKTANYETLTSHRLDIQVEDSDTTKEPTTYVQIMTVKDMPDMPPVWIGLEPTKNVPESSGKDTPIMTLNARDGDVDILDTIIYSFKVTDGDNSDGIPYFSLDKDTGVISVNTELDAFEISEHRPNGLVFTIEVTATEVNDPLAVTTNIITFVVVDEDNSKPTFKTGDEPPWDVIPFQESDVGVFHRFTVVDKDVDLGLNKYSAELIPPTEGGDDKTWFTDYIELFPLEGSRETNFEVRLKDDMHLDYDTVPQWRSDVVFEVVITSTFNVADTISGQITLKVIDQNDNRPIWSFAGTDFPVELEENSKKGYELGVLRATDGDSEDAFGTPSLRYGWDPTSIRPAYLDIDPISGSITIIEETAFNYELRTEETYVVKVWDMEHIDDPKVNDNAAILKITVTDVNDEKPVLRVTPNAKVTILEGTEPGPVNEVTITATDADKSPGNGFDLEFKLAEATAFVNGEKVQISATDWFEVVKDSTTSAILQLKAKPNREEADSVELTISVEDLKTDTRPEYADKKSDEVTLIINIQDVNDELPYFDPIESDLSVLEETDCKGGESAFQRRIVDVVARDEDQTSVFCYELTSPDPKGQEMLDLVELFPSEGSCNSNGKVTLRRREATCVDREKFTTLYYRLTVYDAEAGTSPRNSNFTDLEITVEDINDHAPVWVPESIQKYYVVESQNGASLTKQRVHADDEVLILPCAAPPEDHKACPQATDNDDPAKPYGQINYVFPVNTGSGITEAFQINEDTGCICELKTDREVTPSYGFKIEAWDNYRGPGITIGSLSAETTISIRVEDINDNSPEFKTDAGEGGIFDRVPEGVSSDFPLTNKILVVDADEGDYAKMTFQIKDIVCTRPNGIACEGQAINAFDIRPKEATSPSQELEIFTTANFNFTYAYGKYCILIEASNEDGAPVAPTTEEYCVEVTDINNRSPYFTAGHDLFGGTNFYVYEGTVTDTTLTNYTDPHDPLIFAAKDDDDPDDPLNAKIDFQIRSIENEEDAQTYFQFNENGELSLKKRWRKDDGVPLITVCVKAVDRAEPSLSSEEVCFVMKLKAEGTFAPEFRVFETTLEVKENVHPDKIGEFFEAIDQDNDGLNIDEPIYYYIAGYDNASTYFGLPDPLKIDINTLLELDYETQTQHKILILASNDPTFVPPPVVNPGTNTSYFEVTVEVIDVFDVAPSFPSSLVAAGIASTDIDNKNITTFVVTDPEFASSNDNITYEISTTITSSDETLDATAEQNPFKITTVDSVGELILNFKVQPAMKGHFSFNVTAYDKGNNNETVTCKIYIIAPDNRVVFKFFNSRPQVLQKEQEVKDILSTAFEYVCNIESILEVRDEAGAASLTQTEVTTHFVDDGKSEPLINTDIINKAIKNPELYGKLVADLYAQGLSLDKLQDEPPKEELDTNQLLMYVFIGGCALLLAVLLIIGTTCYFKNSSLNRKVRALNATAEPQQSGMDFRNDNEALPNTNVHANKNSNPIWAEDDNGKRMDFDAESIQSEASVLSGVEVQDFKADADNSDGNSIYQNDDDYGEAYGEDAGEHANQFGDPFGSVRNPAYNPAYQEDKTVSYDYPKSLGGGGGEFGNHVDSSAPSSINPYASVARRNPLMTMGLDEFEDA